MSETSMQPVRQSVVVAELHEVFTEAGRVWRFVSANESVVDHAWQQRDRLLQLSNGATALEICWQPEDGAGVTLAHAPQLPVVTD